MEWKKGAIATLQKYTTIQIIDKIAEPDQINPKPCPEIYPHIRDEVLGDGNCGFRALSKQITGTEFNHAAIRAALVQFMCISCEGLSSPPLIMTQTYPSMDNYIETTHMDKPCTWITEIELHYIAPLLQITIATYLTYGNQRRCVILNPILKVTQGMMSTKDHHLHLYHNSAGNHYDRVVLKVFFHENRQFHSQ